MDDEVLLLQLPALIEQALAPTVERLRQDEVRTEARIAELRAQRDALRAFADGMEAARAEVRLVPGPSDLQ